MDERTNEREGAAGLTRPLRGTDDVAQVQRIITILRDRRTRSESGNSISRDGLDRGEINI